MYVEKQIQSPGGCWSGTLTQAAIVTLMRGPPEVSKREPREKTATWKFKQKGDIVGFPLPFPAFGKGDIALHDFFLHPQSQESDSKKRSEFLLVLPNRYWTHDKYSEGMYLFHSRHDKWSLGWVLRCLGMLAEWADLQEDGRYLGEQM